MSSHDIHFSSKKPEWYTPPLVASLARQVLGTIDLDPASCAAANRNIQAVNYYDEDTNGLAQPWYGRVWLNPPYGDEIQRWVPRLIGFYEAGLVTEAIALVPARTDTAWFQPLFSYVLCFWRGRLHFSDAKESAPFPSVVAYFGPNVEQFRSTFSAYGRIIRGSPPAPHLTKRHKPIQTLFL